MARLTIIAEIETNKAYDDAALENAKLRRASDNNHPTMADQFGESVSNMLGGQRFVDRVESVDVKVVAEEGHTHSTTLPRKAG